MSESTEKTKKVPGAIGTYDMSACQVVCAVLGCGALEADRILQEVGQVDQQILRELHAKGDVDGVRKMLFPESQETEASEIASNTDAPSKKKGRT